MIKRSFLTLIVTLLFLMPVSLFAQLGIGGSFEIRDKADVDGVPRNGIGLRIENSFGPKTPLLKLGFRLHASLFNKGYNFQAQLPNIAETEFESSVYDFGAAIIGEVKLPFLANPYAGLGIGYEIQDIRTVIVPNLGLPSQLDPVVSTIDNNSLFYNAFVGVKFSMLPIAHPFIEYRYSGFTGLDSVTEQPGRLQFGILLEF
jgi:hypothetical protein